MSSADLADQHLIEDEEPPLQQHQNFSIGPTSEGDISNPPNSSLNLPPDLKARLFDLARSGYTNTLKAYMDAGVIPPNLTNQDGDTLLMISCCHNHPSTISMLLSKRAHPNVINKRGHAAVASAVFKGYKEVVKILVRAGADVSAGQPNAWDIAKSSGRQDLLRILRMGQGVGNDSLGDEESEEVDLGDLRMGSGLVFKAF